MDKRDIVNKDRALQKLNALNQVKVDSVNDKLIHELLALPGSNASQLTVRDKRRSPSATTWLAPTPGGSTRL